MEKINILIPITAKEFDLSKKTKELKAVLKEYEDEFSVFYIASYAFKKPKNYRKLENINLINTDLKVYNKLIKRGFEEVENGAVIVLDQQDKNYIHILKQILEHKKPNNIVLYKATHNKSKFTTYFYNLFIKFYYAYLKFWALEEDLLCSNSFQYFNENATSVIKSLENKNAYLRNFKTLSGYEVDKIEEVVEKEEKSLNLVSFKNNNTLIGTVAFSASFVFAITTLIFTKLILAVDNGIGYYFLILGISVCAMLLSGYLIVKDIIKLRADL